MPTCSKLLDRQGHRPLVDGSKDRSVGRRARDAAALGGQTIRPLPFQVGAIFGVRSRVRPHGHVAWRSATGAGAAPVLRDAAEQIVG